MAPELSVGARMLHALRGAAGPWTAACVNLALVFGVGLEVRARGRSEEAVSYHERIKTVAQSTIPLSVGDWLGRESDVNPFAVSLLRPNVLVDRVYQNLRTAETASLLFVHCSDARDLLGHYPPVCYPGHGLVSEAADRRDWKVGGQTIQGMRYRFGQSKKAVFSELVVDNFMVLPTGKYGRDMDAVNGVAQEPRLRRLGAAEVQIVTDGSMSEERRDEVFRALVERIVPLLECVGAGTEHD